MVEKISLLLFIAFSLQAQNDRSPELNFFQNSSDFETALENSNSPELEQAELNDAVAEIGGQENILFNASILQVGSQNWMSTNLRVDKFRDGTPILHAKNAAEWEKANRNQQAAWCHYEFDPKNDEIYGKLYNWYAVNDPRGLAPMGWHIPNHAEWDELQKHLGKDAGKKMKNTHGWKENGNESNESRFSALPSGYVNEKGLSLSKGLSCFWWSATKTLTQEDSNSFSNDEANEGFIFGDEEEEDLRHLLGEEYMEEPFEGEEEHILYIDLPNKPTNQESQNAAYAIGLRSNTPLMSIDRYLLGCGFSVRCIKE